MPDVQMPDGTIITGVPEGTTKSELLALIQKNRELPASLGGGRLGAAETALSMGSAILAEPVAGLAGLFGLVTDDAETGASNVAATREALTFSPRTQQGQRTLGAIGETLEPVGEFIADTEDFLGDAVFEATGSPAAAAAAKSAPTLAAELLGVASLRGATKVPKTAERLTQSRLVADYINKAAPEVEAIANRASSLYKSVDDLGATVKPNKFQDLLNRTEKRVIKEGYNPKVNPEMKGVLDEFRLRAGSSPSISEVDTLRKVASSAAQSQTPATARLGSMVIDEIDDFLARVDEKSLVGNVGKDVSDTLKTARDLVSRRKKQEVLAEAFGKADLQASGFENGLRTQFRSILNNKKKSRGFTADEKAAMRRVVKGGGAENTFRLLGKFGLGEDQAIRVLVPGLGATVAGAALGPTAAVAVPVIGQVSQKLAQRLTRSNAAFADEVVRAGKNARKITDAYLKNTPKAKRSVSELTELLLKRDADPASIRKGPSGEANQLVRDAAFLTGRARKSDLAGVLLGGAASDKGDEDDE